MSVLSTCAGTILMNPIRCCGQEAKEEEVVEGTKLPPAPVPKNTKASGFWMAGDFRVSV